jgi:hypothetical protein
VYTEALWYPGRQFNLINAKQQIQRKSLSELSALTGGTSSGSGTPIKMTRLVPRSGEATAYSCCAVVLVLFMFVRDVVVVCETSHPQSIDYYSTPFRCTRTARSVDCWLWPRLRRQYFSLLVRVTSVTSDFPAVPCAAPSRRVPEAGVGQHRDG